MPAVADGARKWAANFDSTWPVLASVSMVGGAAFGELNDAVRPATVCVNGAAVCSGSCGTPLSKLK